MSEEVEVKNKKPQEKSSWNKYFSGWNIIINGLIAFIPITVVWVILEEIGLRGAIIKCGVIYGFIYLAGLSREKISKKAKND